MTDAVPPTGAAAAPPLRPTPDPALAQVAREFEGMVLSELLRPMFDSLSTDGLGGGGVGEEMFRPMLVQNYAEAMARNGGIGFAQNILDELMRMQAAALTPTMETPDGADR